MFVCLFLTVLGLRCCVGFLLQWLLLWSTGSEAQLWCMGLIALWCVTYSQISDRSHVSCIGRQILYH